MGVLTQAESLVGFIVPVKEPNVRAFIHDWITRSNAFEAMGAHVTVYAYRDRSPVRDIIRRTKRLSLGVSAFKFSFTNILTSTKFGSAFLETSHEDDFEKISGSLRSLLGHGGNSMSTIPHLTIARSGLDRRQLKAARGMQHQVVRREHTALTVQCYVKDGTQWRKVHSFRLL